MDLEKRVRNLEKKLWTAYGCVLILVALNLYGTFAVQRFMRLHLLMEERVTALEERRGG